MKVNNRHLKALKSIAGRDETRYVLNGVHFEPCEGGYLMVAADRRRLAVIFKETKEELLLPFTLAARDIDFLPARVLHLDICHSNGKITIDGLKPDYMPLVWCDAIEGDFPKWRQAIPKDPFVPSQFVLDGTVLEPFIKCTMAVCRTSNAMYFRASMDPLGPISILNGNPNFYGLIMPMRSEADEKQIPKWLL